MVAGVVLAVAGVRTAAPPHAPLPDVAEHRRRWSALHAGIDPKGNRLVAGWLQIMHAISAPLVRAGVHPDVVTLAGPWFTGAALVTALAGGRWLLLATLWLVAGAVADGLDGTVAVLTDRARPWGVVLDALADRLADIIGIVALLAVAHVERFDPGVGPGDVVAQLGGATAVVALFSLEYLRARAGQLGRQVQTITVGERPTRVVIVAVALWCGGLFPGAAAVIAIAGLWGVAAVSVVGFVHLLAAVRAALR